jgi:hypothetical protein
MTHSTVLPLAHVDGGGALNTIVILEAQYPARCSPCQRLNADLSIDAP